MNIRHDSKEAISQFNIPRRHFIYRMKIDGLPEDKLLQALEVITQILNSPEHKQRCWCCHKPWAPRRKPNMILQRVMLEEQTAMIALVCEKFCYKPEVRQGHRAQIEE